MLRDYIDDGSSKVSRGSKRKVSNTNEVFYYPCEPKQVCLMFSLRSLLSDTADVVRSPLLRQTCMNQLDGAVQGCVLLLHVGKYL